MTDEIKSLRAGILSLRNELREGTLLERKERIVAQDLGSVLNDIDRSANFTIAELEVGPRTLQIPSKHPLNTP